MTITLMTETQRATWQAAWDRDEALWQRLPSPMHWDLLGLEARRLHDMIGVLLVSEAYWKAEAIANRRRKRRPRKDR